MTKIKEMIRIAIQEVRIKQIMRDEGRKKQDRGKRSERRLEREGTRYRRGEMLNKKGFRGTEKIRHNKRLYYFYVIIQNFLFLERKRFPFS